MSSPSPEATQETGVRGQGVEPGSEATPRKAKGVWQRDFVLLWSGQSLSMVGSQVSILAIPAVAVLKLNASAFAVGLLGTFEMLGYPVFGLIAGVLVDRVSHRRTMIVCETVSALALAMVPLSAGLGFLSMPLLYAVATIAGISRIFFGVAYQAVVPNIVVDEDLVDANAKLNLSSATAQVGGPSVGGFLLAVMQPTTAVLADVGSFVVSALSIAALRQPKKTELVEPAPTTAAPVKTPRTVFSDIRAGLRIAFGDRRLRSLLGASATVNFSYHVGFAVFFVFAYRRLDLSTAVVGIDFAVGGVGAIVGAAAATRIMNAVKLGPALIGGVIGIVVSNWLLPAAALSVAPVFLGASMFLFGFSLSVYNIGQITLRQRLTPKELLGRISATFITLTWSAVPVAFAVGGVLGSILGPTSTLVVAAALSCAAPFWLIRPLRGVQSVAG
jgi:hypothetical protein